ncbi:hypothetical protein AGABI1DRAFT_116366 [Agaricus bisporus var. burnettii JB137-S8]|uniref:Uncharacterized protein n=1 Tax=Agaricus bisporus var. burnettii (strain JB137-S8 / ATCC MYA-4627 / FGSC 10392) TaxID=597362 RepID=K5XLK8_AGABU|nr:uncharacterized protein AGABI1DRAFT_116366 [Agaricus bisporus var. burnettii JB137-S8]EKM75425.1 hypothetical protein AGABI1DRAFT_116366 [Agaricus bisporus var. burnettii JB137-S8]
MTRAHPRSFLELFKLVNHHRTYFPELPLLSEKIEAAYKSNLRRRSKYKWKGS